MSAKRHAPQNPKKPNWQPEHWLMLWEIIWKRLPIVILVTLLGTAELIRAKSGEHPSWNSIKEMLSEVFSIR
ncbi:MAG: hypothetical protein JNN17_07480 [Verrucomicrobiaceae bacterium]|nr:hypothetical protein [Verrucomicrobiaceae bacterium]